MNSVLMRGIVFPKTFDIYIKVFLNNESVCHFMVVQLSLEFVELFWRRRFLKVS